MSRLGFTFAVMFAFGVRTADAQGAPPAAPSDTSAAAVVRAYFEAFNAKDVDGVVARLAPDFVWFSVENDSLMVQARGPAAVRAQLTDYFRSLPSGRSEVEELSALGPWVHVRERAHWYAASGPRSQASLSVYEVRGGLIRRVWYYPVVR